MEKGGFMRIFKLEFGDDVSYEENLLYALSDHK